LHWVPQDASHASQLSAPDWKVLLGQATTHEPAYRKGTSAAHEVQSVLVGPEHPAQSDEHGVHTLVDASENVPAGHASTQRLPCLYGVAGAQEMHSVTPAPRQLWHEPWHAWQLPLASNRPCEHLTSHVRLGSNTISDAQLVQLAELPWQLEQDSSHAWHSPGGDSNSPSGQPPVHLPEGCSVAPALRQAMHSSPLLHVAQSSRHFKQAVPEA